MRRLLFWWRRISGAEAADLWREIHESRRKLLAFESEIETARASVRRARALLDAADL